jgi:DNA-binding IclR family transcriptional regulator
MDTEGSARGGIQVLTRSADILRALQGNPGGLTQVEIGEHVGLPRSTVSRLLAALEDLGYVTSRGPRGLYRLGPEIIAMSTSARRGVLAGIRPYLESLSRELNETVDLSLLDGTRAVFLDQVVSAQRLRAVSAVGDSFPLHAFAGGKAILASMTPTELDALLPERLERLTPNTITSRRALRKELDVVRRTGIAYDREEHSLGICAVGAVIPSIYGDIVAVSVPTPTHRFVGEEERLTTALHQFVDEVTDWVGSLPAV